MPEHRADLRDRGLVAHVARDAEVGDLDDPLLGAQQVARLDVAVHDAVAMGVVQAAAGVRDDRERLGHREDAAVAQDLGGRLAADVLHDDVVAPGRLVEPEVEHLHDVGVHQARRRERLAAEARDELRVLGEVLGEHLDGDVALQAAVVREAHRRHAADAEAIAELVAAREELSLMARSPRRCSCPVVVSVGGVVGRRRCGGVVVRRRGRCRSCVGGVGRSAPSSSCRSASWSSWSRSWSSATQSIGTRNDEPGRRPSRRRARRRASTDDGQVGDVLFERRKGLMPRPGSRAARWPAQGGEVVLDAARRDARDQLVAGAAAAGDQHCGRDAEQEGEGETHAH